MKVIYNRLLPLPGFSAMMLFGVIFARRTYKPLPANTINHEAIHAEQAREMGGYWRYYIKYIRLWAKYGYRANPMECEAYANESNLSYLPAREPFAWRKFVTE